MGMRARGAPGGLLSLAMGGVLVASCSNESASTPPEPTHGPAVTTDFCAGAQSRVTGRVVEVVMPGATTGVPLPGALVVVENGNLFSGNPDPAAANPAYVWGTVADAGGYFAFDCPCGSTLGIHAYAPGHKENNPGMPVTIMADTDIAPIALVAETASAEPMLTDVAVEPPSVIGGGQVTFSVSAAAPAPVATDGGSKRDWLSDEVLCLEPHTNWGRAMTPPAAPMESATGMRDYPDGVWTRTVTAPTTPGRYTYSFVAATLSGVSSNVVTGVLTVQ